LHGGSLSCTVNLTLFGSNAVVALIYGNLSTAREDQYATYSAAAVALFIIGGISAYLYLRFKHRLR
jgi:hypothetical protein